MIFESRLPPGAEGLSLLISTKNLDVKESWKPAVSEGNLQLEVGDALTRSITLRADDVPGMALPEINMPEPDGMSAYPGQAAVEDDADRGSLTGVRKDSVTFICERPGEFVLPAISIPWWDIDADQLNRVLLPSVTVTVVESTSASQESDDEAVSESTSTSKMLLSGAAFVGALVALAIWFRNPLAAQMASWETQFAAWRQRLAESESATFAELKRACRANDPIAAHNALMHWLQQRWDRAETVTIHAFTKRYDDPQLAHELQSLERAAVSRSTSWSGQPLIVEATRFRLAQVQLPRYSAADSSLPPLNPTGTR